jgi:hypothetical protein
MGRWGGASVRLGTDQRREPRRIHRAASPRPSRAADRPRGARPLLARPLRGARAREPGHGHRRRTGHPGRGWQVLRPGHRPQRDGRGGLPAAAADRRAARAAARRALDALHGDASHRGRARLRARAPRHGLRAREPRARRCRGLGAHDRRRAARGARDRPRLPCAHGPSRAEATGGCHRAGARDPAHEAYARRDGPHPRARRAVARRLGPCGRARVTGPFRAPRARAPRRRARLAGGARAG